MGIEDIALDEWRSIFAQMPIAGAVALPDAIPCIVTWKQDEPREGIAGVAVAVMYQTTASDRGFGAGMIYVLFEDGGSFWCPSDRVVYKYQPDGPYRLKLGWARKGPDGDGRDDRRISGSRG